MIVELDKPLPIEEFRKLSHADIADALDPEPSKNGKDDEEETEPEEVEQVTQQAETTEDVEEAEEEEVQLPKGVKKRIAKEAERAAQVQSEIDRAVGARKAKEAELAKLTSGAEPVTTTEKANAKPVRPDIDTFEGTLPEYKAASAKYDDDLQAWLQSETRKTVEEELTAKNRKELVESKWKSAKEKHGDDFPALMQKLTEGLPEPLQLAISEQDDWDDIAVYLAKNPEALKELVDINAVSSARAIRHIGKLELTSDAVKTAEKLPAPLKKVAGEASASIANDINKMDFASMKRELKRRGF